jgi:transcription initiation factor IIE alpha subunit
MSQLLHEVHPRRGSQHGVCPVCGSQLEYIENVEEINKLTKVYEILDKL